MKARRGFADRRRKAHSHHGGPRAMTAPQLRAHCVKHGTKHLSAAQIGTAQRRGYLKS